MKRNKCVWVVLYDAKGYVVNVCNKICDKGGLRTIAGTLRQSSFITEGRSSLNDGYTI